MKDILIYLFAGIAAIAMVGAILNRILQNKGFGIRMLQFISVGVIFPILVTLTLLDLMPISTIAVVAGTIFGYVFAVNEQQKHDNS